MVRKETRLEVRIRHDFPEPGSAEEVLRLLDELDDRNDAYLASERVHAAVILLAQGNIARLREWLHESRKDWRDVLVAADLAHDDWPTRLDHELGPESPTDR